MLAIRKAMVSDTDAIWNIIRAVIAGGDTYVFDPGSTKAKMLNYWLGADKHCFVALEDAGIVGTFIIKQNQPDLGSHVANASYMTSPNHTGQGIGKAMALFSIEEAKRLGFLSIQFNLVVKSNERAIGLWRKLGFQIVGEIPDAFNHRQLGLTNAYIMWRAIA